MVDCSLTAQAERRQQIARLRAKLAAGTQSVSDRSRSVGYFAAPVLLDVIRELERELAFCDGIPEAPRLFGAVPLIKAL